MSVDYESVLRQIKDNEEKYGPMYVAVRPSRGINQITSTEQLTPGLLVWECSLIYGRTKAWVVGLERDRVVLEYKVGSQKVQIPSLLCDLSVVPTNKGAWSNWNWLEFGQ